jgi:hypothetical protein
MSDEQQLNNELLEEDVQSTEAPKRNSKDDLIAKIINICADNGMELEHSNSKLRRMTKDQLCKILAEKLERGVKSQMAAQVGAKANAPDSVIALGALKMIHNIAANSAEKGLNLILPKYGYQVHGFTDSLKDPAVNEAVEQCLAEIAAESDILQHIESPYVRLAIAWGGALVISIRSTAKPGGRKPHRINKYTYAPSVGPQPTRPEAPSQRSAGGGAPDRQVHRVQPPSCDDEDEV